jgi:hypothetical protein
VETNKSAVENKRGVRDVIRKIVDAQHVMGYCSVHLTTIIKNGKVRNRFAQMSSAVDIHRDILEKFCQLNGYSCTAPETACRYCGVKPESFSLIGALNIGVEVTTYLLDQYRKLESLVADPGDRKIFREIGGELSRQRNYLKAEQKYVVKKEQETEPTFMDSHCMPEILSRLSR